MIFASVKIKESCCGNSLFFVDFLTGTPLEVIGQKPRGANRNYAGGCRYFGWYILFEGIRELLGCNYI